jgi:hypothetical protein
LKYRDEICDLFTLDEPYTTPVKTKMQEAENISHQTSYISHLRLGVHIRRGDYAEWRDGQFYFDNAVYAAHINRFAEMHPDQRVHVYLSTNDPEVSATDFQQLCPQVVIHHLQGSAPEDLFMLSECDYLIGPPSTFSLTACIYHDIPLCWMEEASTENMRFDKFENQFKNIR